MKITSILMGLLLLYLSSFATNYYIRPNGNNSNTGLSDAQAWQTVTKINGFTFAANDSILFHRDSSFRGGLIVPRSNLHFGAYGTGAKPILTGFQTVSGWTNLGGNIWDVATPAGVSRSLNLVTRDGVVQQVGRYPNTNVANSGYLTLTARTLTSITGPAQAINWTNAQVAIRIAAWETRMRTVTSMTAGNTVVNFANIVDSPKIGYGYFFQRDPRTLDRDGEWYQDSNANRLQMYFVNNNPAAYTIQVATVDTVFKNLRGGTTVNDLVFTGSNIGGMVTDGQVGVTVTNCEANINGRDGLAFWFCTNVTVTGCYANNSLSSNIRVRSSDNVATNVNISVTNCILDSSAMIVGMAANEQAPSNLTVNGGLNVTATNNYITNSGYNGIAWHGNNVNLTNNFIDSFCRVMDDGGGIYTYTGSGSTIVPGINRNIIGNIIIHGIGQPNGTSLGAYSANGIYTDEGTRDVTIFGNSIAYMPYNGLQGNGNGNLTIRNNTVFQALYAYAYQRLARPSPEPRITGFVIKKNIFYPYRFRFREQAINVPDTLTINQAILVMGSIDSSYYCLRTGTDTSLVAQSAYSNGSHFTQQFSTFGYMQGTIGIETHALQSANTGTFHYNATNAATTVTFTGLSKKDVYGNVYNNSAPLGVWSSIILIPNGSAPSSGCNCVITNAKYFNQ